ncbi:hypothetical protein [Pedobacter ghigonis]|uniref:hypothetical protein n=1 Tax=Pedobacter ghigonis TaxID=2730403 RepID=UPI00158A726D|nr:hypothetical protein [Pedobacter ghigonis]
MNLEQEWQNLGVEFSAKANQIETSKLTIDEKAHSLLQELIFKLKWKLRWIRIIDLPLLALAIFVSGDLKILLLLIVATYEICRALGVRDFNKIKTAVDYNANTKQVLNDNLKAIKKILRGETIFGYIFLPLAGPIGLLAYRLCVHHTFEQVIQLPNFFIQMALLALVGIPFTWLTKRMNNSIFAKPLKQLTDKLNDLMD